VQKILKEYLVLAKPGIIVGNLMTTIGGFLFGARGIFDPTLFAAVIAGLGLVIASGCVFNNILDLKIDRSMHRTRKRALVTGIISVRSAFIYGLILGILGFGFLYFLTNMLAVILAAAGFISYVFIYGYAKRKSYWGTVVGSIPGAIPIIVGYCAVVGRIDTGAILLFLIMAAWQMPHFYAISIFRHDDYKNASVPVMSVARGIAATKAQILYFTVIYFISLLLLFITGYAGTVFLIIMSVLGGLWVILGASGLQTQNDNAWARKMFGYSLYNLLGLSVMLSLNVVFF